MHPKFTVIVHFGAKFTAKKPKILLKTNISGKTTFLGISKNVSHQVPEKPHDSCKVNQKHTIFGPNLDINCPPGTTSKDYQKFSHSL